MTRVSKLTIKRICVDISNQVKNKIVLFLHGGESSESEGSTKVSGQIVKILKKHVKKIVVANPKHLREFLVKLSKADIVFNGMYGGYGEDGRIQGLLDIFKKRYTGSSTLPSAIGMNKYFFRQLLKSWSVPVPGGQRVDNWIKNPKSSLSTKSKFLLKPVDEGDSYGIKFCESLDDLRHAVSEINPIRRRRWLIEEYLPGRPGTMALIGFRDIILPGRPLVLSLPKTQRIYTTALKYFGDDRLRYNYLKGPTVKKIVEETQKLFYLLGCRGAVRFDFIYNHGAVKYIELNTLPGLYKGSNLHMAFKHIITFDELVLLILSSAFFPDQEQNESYEYFRKNLHT